MTDMSHAAEDIRGLNAEVRQLRAELSRISETVKDFTQQTGASAVQKGKQMANDLQDQVRHQAQTVVDTIEERPIVSSAVAFGIGFAVGILCRGRD